MESLNAYTQQIDTRALESVSLFAGGLWNVTTAVSGSNPSRGAEPHSSLHSPPETAGQREPARILLVEDNTLDILMVREALAEHQVAATLHVAEDGERAVRFIDATEENERAPCPALILLDLNLPKRNGSEVLAYIRRSKKCAHAKVVIITSSDSPEDRAETRRLGARGYFLKPPSYEDYLKIGEIVRNLLKDHSEEG